MALGSGLSIDLLATSFTLFTRRARKPRVEFEGAFYHVNVRGKAVPVVPNVQPLRFVQDV